MLPNFLIIGTAKAATSALYEYLRDHPEVFMPRRKELHHFAVHPHTSGPHWNLSGADRTNPYYPVVERPDYEAFFAPAGHAGAVGEACPTYMFYTAAAGNIRDAIPHAKLIALLRDPADRAYSAWLHLVRDGHEKLSFAEALQQEESRLAQGKDGAWAYRSFGYYYQKLTPYFALFPRDQILVLLQEEFLRSPERTMSEVYQFLEIDTAFVARTGIKHNVTGLPRYPRLHQFVEKDIHTSLLGRIIKAPLSNDQLLRALTRVKNWNLRKPEPPARLIEELREGYRDDILKCEALIGKDLSHWLRPEVHAAAS